MTESRRITDEDVLSVFRDLSDPHEALSTREVSDALDCSRRTTYDRLSALADSAHLNTKKVGNQVRIWWLATDPDHPHQATVGGEAISAVSSSQTLRLEFRSERMAQPYIERGGSEVNVSIEEPVSLKDGTHLQYWSISGISLQSYLEIIESQPAAIDTHVLSSVGGVHRVEIHSTADSLLAAVTNHDGRLTGGTLVDGTLRIIGEFPATVDSDTVIEAITDVYPDLELVSRRLLVTPYLSRTLLKETLSDRQWTAIQLAYYAGYFDQPRKSTGEDIAERMGITRQTFNRHLREAERRFVQFVLEDMDDDQSGNFTPVG
ncbi:bacterio-opsin activator domain-containing protein [Natrarchaeobius sp. A-rgal3]|uniref:helix-turn-helix domain-containing protein n=1 Tax=Natrarchaeobius versutus TaxID=1679078 RepID=UPI00350F22D3